MKQTLLVFHEIQVGLIGILIVTKNIFPINVGSIIPYLQQITRVLITTQLKFEADTLASSSSCSTRNQLLTLLGAFSLGKHKRMTPPRESTIVPGDESPKSPNLQNRFKMIKTISLIPGMIFRKQKFGKDDWTHMCQGLNSLYWGWSSHL